MGKYNRVKADAFNEIQKDAGMILSDFDPTGKTAIQDSQILFTTTGGIDIKCQPIITDFGEDIDNVPNGTMELMEIDQYDCSIGFTAVSVTDESVRWQLGAADISNADGTSGTNAVKKITPRVTIKTDTDFKDLWWVGPMHGGGFCACVLKNAFTADGFNLKTTKKGKGNCAVSLGGHYSINNVDEVPMDFYVIPGPVSST